MKSQGANWNLFEKTWLFTSSAIIVILSLIWKDSPLALFASLTGIINVVLCAKGKVSAYYFALAQGIVYLYLSWNAHLFGEVMFNVVMIPVGIMGIITWKKNMSADGSVVQARNLTAKQRVILLAVTIAAIVGYIEVLKALGGSFTAFDSASTVCSVIATALTFFRYTEQWIIWVVVDTVAFIMWVMVFLQGDGDITIAVMWFTKIFNAVYGLVNWNRMAKANVSAAA